MTAWPETPSRAAISILSISAGCYAFNPPIFASRPMSQFRLDLAKSAMIEATKALSDGHAAKAAAAFLRAISNGAGGIGARRGLALALSALGRHDEAIAALEPLAEANRDNPDFLNMLGILHKRADQLDRARELLENAIQLRPDDPALWQNLGNSHEALGNFQTAADCYHKGLQINPDDAELWRLHGRELALLGQHQAAAESIGRALALAPQRRDILSQYIQTLLAAGNLDTAKALITRYRDKAPNDPDIATLAARIALHRGRRDQAKALLQELLDHHPGQLNAGLLLADILDDADREGANAVLEALVTAHPDNPRALLWLIDSLSRSRYGREADHIARAYALACQFMTRFPKAIPGAARTLRTIFMQVLDEGRMEKTGTLPDLLHRWHGPHSVVHHELGQVQTLQDRLDLVEWHRAWGRRASAGIAPLEVTPLPALHNRKLRVGFMSSDLRHHPVSYFALPLLEGYDPDRVEVFCYSFNEKPADRVQDYIARKVSGFRLWPGRPDQELAEGIARDRLDILFELGGSTAMNRLEVMAYRPAPITASWLGYPHSAGLDGIDLILTDPYLRPDDPRLLIEQPFEMPHSWVALSRLFAPHEITPATPEARNGHLTFGTANNPYKFTTACLNLWAEVLRQVPNSRFLFLRPEAAVPDFITNSRTAFARRGIDPDRLDFTGIRGDHMRHYNSIDIALDSLPHVGGTTTCEALWMGVPTISLVGPGFPERLSYSNLVNAGLGDLAVFAPAAYVETAAALADNPARRLALRHGLRAQIQAHPLGQPTRFVQDFYQLAAKVAS